MATVGATLSSVAMPGIGSIATVATSQTTTSTSYTDLATVGPSITPTSGVAQGQLIGVAAFCNNSNAASATIMTPAIAGTATDGVGTLDNRATVIMRATALTIAAAVASGATHTAKYKVTANTGTWVNRDILAIPI